MSMDDVRDAMAEFAGRLNELNLEIRTSFQSLNEAHQNVDPLWRDSMRQQYDAIWAELEEEMHRYLNHVGPELLEKLVSDLRHTREYLDG